jgi:TctA family transporter
VLVSFSACTVEKMLSRTPEKFGTGMIASMRIGNLMLMVLNLPSNGFWVRMLLVPYRLLSIAILFFCCIGV